jgi:hypothetical protein
MKQLNFLELLSVNRTRTHTVVDVVRTPFRQPRLAESCASRLELQQGAGRPVTDRQNAGPAGLAGFNAAGIAAQAMFEIPSRVSNVPN